MKSKLLVLIMLVHPVAFASNESECKRHVADNIGTFSICHNSGVTQWSGKEVVNFDVKSCTHADDKSDWVCTVSQRPWPSSDCEMEIVLDRDCYFNKSTKITKEGREDI